MARFHFPVAFALALLPAAPSLAQTDVAGRLRGDLLGGRSATQVLSQWCGQLGYADPPLVRAVRDTVRSPAPAGLRDLLKVGADEPIAYRRVQLTCGTHVLSQADNWYVPARLTPAMNQTLDTTDTSFGTVVKPLDFHRDTLEVTPVDTPRTILRVRALLRLPDGTPFSLVVENYTRDLAPNP